MRSTGCTQTTVINYQWKLCNIPEERISMRKFTAWIKFLWSCTKLFCSGKGEQSVILRHSSSSTVRHQCAAVPCSLHPPHWGSKSPSCDSLHKLEAPRFPACVHCAPYFWCNLICEVTYCWSPQQIRALQLALSMRSFRPQPSAQSACDSRCITWKRNRELGQKLFSPIFFYMQANVCFGRSVTVTALSC